MPPVTSITPKQAHDYLDRWKLVKQAEVAELRASPLATKAQQLAVLMASRTLFGTDPNRERQIQEVRDRWALIRHASHD